VMVVERLGRERLRLKLGPGRLNLRDLTAGASVWLTSDPSWDSHWQRAAQRPTASQSIGLQLRVRGQLGQPLVLETIEGGTRISSRMPLQAAQQRALDRQRLEEQLGRLGGSGWVLERLELDLEGDLFLPVAELNRMRRELLEQLQQPPALASSQGPLQSSAVDVPSVLRQLLPEPSPQSSTDQTGLVVLVRSLAQLEALIPLTNLPIASVVADLEQPRDLREAVAIGRGHWPDGIWLAGARITRPNESWSLEPLIRARPDGYLVRNADQLERLTPLAPCVGDFSLNTANPLSAGWYLEHWGLERVTASYDLNLQQLLDLAAGVDPSRIEVTLHQHMPLFHMDHCVFCAFLSDGHDHTDCGRPCEQHTVTLRDRSGVEHPLRADLGCRNTLFNGTAQTGVEGLPALLEIGIRQVRLELLDEDAASTQRRVRLYADALLGRRASRDVWSQEQIHHQLGVTRGSLRVKGPERTSQISR
jgi:putative protease